MFTSVQYVEYLFAFPVYTRYVQGHTGDFLFCPFPLEVRANVVSLPAPTAVVSMFTMPVVYEKHQVGT